LSLQTRAAVVITDSGGIQEETTYLGVTCLTLRPNTERPITVTTGTNILVGDDRGRLVAELENILESRRRKVLYLPYGMLSPERASLTFCFECDTDRTQIPFPLI